MQHGTDRVHRGAEGTRRHQLPATKDQLIERARANNADTDILAVLEDIPDGEYGGPNEISKAAAK
ncbi:MAG: DUF2795 domain-containing protein [Trebonia sp.]|uniref:DUF2795 domain-containing protein n=1 Tax=Trebonia sp. TaxID=2767075 RepID=UPI003BAFC006